MLSMYERVFFIIVFAISGYLTYRNFRAVIDFISRGKPEKRKINFWMGFQSLLLQKPIFKTRFITSLFHSFVLLALIYALVNLQDVISGFVRGFMLFGNTPLQKAFNFTADVLSALALISVLYFGLRRFIFGDRRLKFPENVPLHENAASGISRDSLIVLVFIFTHVFSRVLHQSFLMDSFDASQPFASSMFVLTSRLSETTRNIMEHTFWWLALGSILVFFPYFPFSKHIHLFFAPVKWSIRREKPYGYIEPLNLMEKLQEEGGEEEVFGALKIHDLSWAQIVDAYACIMCNRCQDVCPANLTGKPLSPSALIINMRYEINSNLFKGGGRNLMEFAIDDDSLWACTTCGACVEVCPVGNEQLLSILQIRRGQILMEGKEAGFSNAFRGMENQGNPWNMPSEHREKWLEGLNVKKAYENPNFRVLYWAGCAAAYDQRYTKVARAVVSILQKANVDFAVLGGEETCTGDSARRTGNEYLFEMLALQNVETLNKYKPGVIITSCPHCYHTIKNEYPDFGLDKSVKVYHHSEYIMKLLEEGKIKVAKSGKTFTFHDPCYLGRHNRVFDEPRNALKMIGNLVEPERKGVNSFCCGAGGGRMWVEERIGKKINLERTEELLKTGADNISVGCPFCMTMISDGVKSKGIEPNRVKDLAEIVLENLTG